MKPKTKQHGRSDARGQLEALGRLEIVENMSDIVELCQLSRNVERT